METKHALIIANFLERLRNQEKNEMKNSISKGYINLLSQNELIEIVGLKYGSEGKSKLLNIENKSKYELIEIIADEHYILSYMIDEVLGKYTL